MDYYNEIKNELINNEITRKVKNYSINKRDLTTYYNVGKILSEAGKHYGEGIIREYSKRLTKELRKKYSVKTLMRMRQFSLLFENVATVSRQLSWSHYVELIPLNDMNIITYYIEVCEEQNLSVRQLREKIKSKEYERLPTDTKNKLIKQDDSNILDFVKNPILIKSKNKYEIVSEKLLHKLILEDIENFLEELGIGFTFIKSEYPIKFGNNYNYIDLLLFNYEYNCFVVVELKVTELKKEYIGQIQVYMNYIDDNLKTINQNKTIGIIICKVDNEYIIKYCSDKRIISRTYKIRS